MPVNPNTGAIDDEYDPWANTATDQPPPNDLSPGWSVTGQGGAVPFADGYGPGAPGTVPPPNDTTKPPTDYTQQVKDEYQQKFGRAPTAAELKSEQENLTKYGWDTGPFGGVKAQIDKRATNTPGAGTAQPSGPGSPSSSVSNYSGLMSGISNATDPVAEAAAREKLAIQVFNDLQAAGHDVYWQNDSLVVDGRTYTVGDFSRASTYKPGDIPTSDIPTFSLDDYFKKATAQTPVEDQADQVVSDLLADPFGGFGEGYSDSLKARAKDTAGAQWAQDDQAITDAAHQLGQDATTSPWAQTQRLGTRFGRDMNLAGINTDIDISTQEKRAQNAQSVAQIGASYAGQKSQQRINALTLASDNVFKQAALTNDRLTLQESVKQAAASLGQSEDKIMTDYIVHKQQELTSRVGLALGFSIDSSKLSQESDQFKQNLMMQLAQLEEQKNQFDATFAANRDDEAWRRANPTPTTGV